MRLYVRMLFRESQRSVSFPQAGPGVEDGILTAPVSAIDHLEIQTERPGGPASPPPARSPAFQHAETAFRRAALFYALGGSVHAATSARLTLLVWNLLPPVHTIAVDNVRLLCGRVLVVVFHHDDRARSVLGPHRRLRGLLILGVRRHASSNELATAARGRSSTSLYRRRTDAEERGSSTTFVRQLGNGAIGYR